MIIAGLGNPGEEYRMTYHNVGMLAMLHLAKKLENEDIAIEWRDHKKLFRYARAGAFTFVLPLTFMNVSGKAIKEAIKKFNAKPSELIVFHDESDLALGAFKISTGQNAAGHKGVESIINALGTKEWERARIGIRKDGEGERKKASEFVLKTISAKERKIFEEVFERISNELIARSA